MAGIGIRQLGYMHPNTNGFRGKHPNIHSAPGTEIGSSLLKIGFLINTCIAITAIATAVYAFTELTDVKDELNTVKKRAATMEAKMQSVQQGDCFFPSVLLF